MELSDKGKDSVIPENVKISITPTNEENGTAKYQYHRRESENKPKSRCQNLVSKVRELCIKNRSKFIFTAKLVLALLYFAYFGYALSFQFGDEESWRLTIFTIFGISLAVFRFVRTKKTFTKVYGEMQTVLNNRRFRMITKWILYVAAGVSIVTYLVIFVLKDHPENLLSLVGLVIFMLLLFLLSTDMSKVQWYTVFWGLTTQVMLAIFFLKTDVGNSAINWTTDRFVEFTKHAGEGSRTAFGDDYKDVRFASLPQILTFIVLIDMLSYFGVIQFLARNVGGVLSFCLGTKIEESMIAVANVFLGTNVSMMLARHEIPHISLSQIFCMLVASMSSMSGNNMLAFRNFGVPMKYLLLASVLSAPAAVVSAKINLPDDDDNDTQETITDKENKPEPKVRQKKASNIFEALSLSIKGAGKILATVLLNMLLFVALGSFIDSTCEWFGNRIKLQNLTFSKICSYIFWPLAFIMGVSTADCGLIAEQIGLRLLINVNLAYINFGKLITNRATFMEYSAVHNDTIYKPNGDVFLPAWNSTLQSGFMTERSEIIGTYALCGAASLKNIGICLGLIGAIAPSRLKAVTTVIFRAFLVSTVASFITACVAGLLYI